MTQLKAATICQAGRIQHEIIDCYLDGNVIPDQFMQMTAANRRLEYALSLEARQTACFAVFDGIGNADQDAALTRLLAEELKKEVGRIALLPLGDLEGLMKRFVSRIDERIRQIAQLDPIQAGSGAGLVCLCLRDRQAVLFQAGPGRAYLLRECQLRGLGENKLAPAFIAAAGRFASTCVTTGPFPIDDHDRLLLCSESLADAVNDELLGQTMEINDPMAAAAQLVGSAMKSDDRENVTATIIAVAPTTAKAHSAQPITGARPVRICEPQQHQVHQAKVLKIPEKPKVAIGKFKLSHFFFWDVVPAWLQFWSLIMLLLLLLLLIWLLGPKLFG